MPKDNIDTLENLQKRINKLNYHRNRYNEEQKKITVICPYCSSIIIIHNINNHLKTKNCIKLKSIVIKNNPLIEDKFLLEINNIKKKFKYGELIE